jgi:hypothetical protein
MQPPAHPGPFFPQAHRHTTSRRKFMPDEDRQLRALVAQLGTKSWGKIATYMPTRSPRQCRDRYKNYLLDSLVSDVWTAREDAILIQKVQEIGPKWVEIAKFLSGRSGNHVKNRWHKHLARDGLSIPRDAPPPPPPPPPPLPVPPLAPFPSPLQLPGLSKSEPMFPPPDQTLGVDPQAIRRLNLGGKKM